MGKNFTRLLGALFAVLLGAMGSTPAFAFTQSNFVSFLLQGCRNDLTPLISLPNGDGKFICPDDAYTTGNLGKGWNELDLVPHRLTTKAGNQSGVTTFYDVYVAADYQTTDNDKVVRTGYDVISLPVVNAAKSDGSCSVSALAEDTNGSASAPFGGGTDVVRYRQVTITQAAGTTCVFDYYQRLALGSHLYPGSSLQSYMFEQEGLSGGKKTISIPVNQIQPQSLSKDMTATQGSDYTWSITKSSNPANLSFGDVCSPTAPQKLTLQVTVTWTRSAANPTVITVITHVYATNPSARTITTDVTDVIYSGTTPVTGGTKSSGPINVPANTTNYLVLTNTVEVPAGTTALNDVATATYTDLVTGIPIPGSTTATASASPQVTITDSTASINDLEQITGLDLSYSTDSFTPAVGAFDGGYIAGTATTGQVSWSASGLTAGGSVVFDKTVYLAGSKVTSGKLSDSATLTETDSLASRTAGPIDIGISSTSTSTLTINKSYSGLTLQSGQKLVFNFKITRTSDSSYVEKSIEFVAGGATSGSIVISGLPADQYLVDELGTMFYPNGCNDASCAFAFPVTDPDKQQVKVDLTTKDGTPTCSGSASFSNKPVESAFPSARVQKTTLPSSSGDWTFTLYRPDGSTAATLSTVKAEAGYFNFGVALLAAGTYTVVETEQTGWDLISGVPNDGSNTKVCSFQVAFPQDLVNKTFDCTFTNYQQGKAKVVKTVNGGATPTSAQSFTFQLRQGASTSADGTTLEQVAADFSNGWTINFTTSLVANATYQMCEWVMPGWNTNLSFNGNPLFVPGSIIPPSLPNPNVNNMTVCVNFKVEPGQTLAFNVDNSPPPGGRALTIGFWKNWASCSNSKGIGQKPVLDQTLAKAPVIGDSTDSHSTLPGVVLSAKTGSMFIFAAPYYLVMHGSTATPNAAPDCSKAVKILDKSTINTGKKMASDPAFNLAAQLLAAELNLVAGAYSNGTVITTINSAVQLLGKYKFDGITHTNISAADATLMNNYAKVLDDYNNNR